MCGRSRIRLKVWYKEHQDIVGTIIKNFQRRFTADDNINIERESLFREI